MAENRYDVVVIGSGAAGAMAAYTLAKAGTRVLMLEAGRDYDPYGRSRLSSRGDWS
jgi:choline dehydrogenase-like flavoprotein